jgi:SAM-dependent methyltransferase
MSIVPALSTTFAPKSAIPDVASELRLFEPLEAPTLRQRFNYLITNPFKNFLVPAHRLRRLMARSKSPMIAESLVRPGGWRSMEFVYRNAEPTDWFDRQALRDSPLSLAARNRRIIVTNLLAGLINRYSTESPVTILGVGAGPGHHVRSAIVESGISPDRVRAFLLDRDDDAFEFGRKQAAADGLAGCIRFLRGDARFIRDVLPDVNAHIIKLVGLIEYLTDPQLVDLLQSLRGVMVPGASLVTHGFNDVYGIRFFLARVFNLHHHRRSLRQLANILESTGFKIVKTVTEPTGIHPIVVAVK